MRDFDLKLVPAEGLALMTAPDVDGGPMYVADFRDSHALVYRATGHFVGFSRRKGLKLGRRPLRMVNGIWIMDEYSGDLRGHEHVELRPELLSLELIESVDSL